MRRLLDLPKSHRSILVADHDDEVRVKVVRSLEMDGFSVYEAQASREVIDIAKKRMIDVLIMEMQLPDLDGIHTLRMIHQLVGPMPCIFIGEHLTKENWLNAMTARAYALLETPFAEDVIRRTVHELINRHFGPSVS